MYLPDSELQKTSTELKAELEDLKTQSDNIKSGLSQAQALQSLDEQIKEKEYAIHLAEKREASQSQTPSDTETDQESDQTPSAE